MRDPLFAVTLRKPNKSIDECVNYIFDTVQKMNCNGFEDDEIFKMAVHYYDEDDLKAKANNSVKVIVNHTVQLTQNDLDIAKERAMEQAIKEAKKTIKLEYVPELTETDLAEVKTKAMNLAVAEAQKKIFEKKKPVSKPIPVKADVVAIEPAQGSLF